MEKYSVLMSVYKKEQPEYLVEALDSMINQTVKPDEIVLVEDGPLTDALYAVIDKYCKSYPNLFNLVINKNNLGLGVALNNGLKVCRNELVARMDTDDVSSFDRCEKQLLFMNEHQDISVVGGQIEEFIVERSNVIGKREVPLSDKDIKGFMKKRCPFNHMSVMFRKTDIIEAGSYKDWLWNEDYFLWIRLALIGKKFANLPETVVYVRTGSDMYQRRGGVNYFISEKNIQNLMYKHKMIGLTRYFINIIERFVLQILMPNWLRGIVFRTFARKK